MYLLAGARLLLRRWITCVAGLLATVAGCYLVAEHVPVQYEATSQMLLILPPDATGEKTPSNPYLNLPEGLVTTANLVAGDQSTKDSMRSLAAQGYTADYTIAAFQGSGPLIGISAIDADPKVALATRDAVMARVDAELVARQDQASVPADQIMRATRSSVSQEAEPKASARTRAVVGTGVLGLILVGLLALGVDQLVRRRTRQRRVAANASTDPKVSVSTAAASGESTAATSGDSTAGDTGRAPADSARVHPDIHERRTDDDADEALVAVPIKGGRNGRVRKRRDAQRVSIADSTVEGVESVDHAERRSMAG